MAAKFFELREIVPNVKYVNHYYFGCDNSVTEEIIEKLRDFVDDMPFMRLMDDKIMINDETRYSSIFFNLPRDIAAYISSQKQGGLPNDILHLSLEPLITHDILDEFLKFYKNTAEALYLNEWSFGNVNFFLPPNIRSANRDKTPNNDDDEIDEVKTSSYEDEEAETNYENIDFEISNTENKENIPPNTLPTSSASSPSKTIDGKNDDDDDDDDDDDEYAYEKKVIEYVKDQKKAGKSQFDHLIRRN